MTLILKFEPTLFARLVASSAQTSLRDDARARLMPPKRKAAATDAKPSSVRARDARFAPIDAPYASRDA